MEIPCADDARQHVLCCFAFQHSGAAVLFLPMAEIDQKGSRGEKEGGRHAVQRYFTTQDLAAVEEGAAFK